MCHVSGMYELGKGVLIIVAVRGTRQDTAVVDKLPNSPGDPAILF